MKDKEHRIKVNKNNLGFVRNIMVIGMGTLYNMWENLREKIKKKIKKKTRGGNHMPITDHHPPYIPHEVVLENILNRLPIRTLIKCSCVCKLWYNFIHSLKKPCLIFSFLDVMDHHHQKPFNNHFFCLSGGYRKHDGDVYRVDLGRIASVIGCECTMRLVGCCYGLLCLAQNVDHMPTISDIHIYNPNRHETLRIFRPICDGYIICYGFGFDSATKEYKVVLISYSVKEEFKCLVFVLGTNSWRETTTNPPSSLRQILGTRRTFSKSVAVFCGGALFWTSTRKPNEMLLSFDLHNEMFQVIQLPPECFGKQQQLEIHLLEFKGSLCAARLEVLGRDDQNSSCFKLHLHILKKKVEQVWIVVVETFAIVSSFSPPYDTRMVSFSDRVLLYWFDREHLHLYDVHMKYLRVVNPCACGVHAFREHYLRPMDYQLSSHIENFLTLRTFVPEGAIKLDNDAIKDILKEDRRSTGGIFGVLGRKPSEYYLLN